MCRIILRSVLAVSPFIKAFIASVVLASDAPSESATKNDEKRSKKSAMSVTARFALVENFAVEELCEIFIAFVPSFVGFIVE